MAAPAAPAAGPPSPSLPAPTQLHAGPQLRIELFRPPAASASASASAAPALAFTFTPSLNRRLDGPGFATELLLAQGYHVVAFKNAADDWFQAVPEAAFATIDAALAALGLPAGTRRVAYGSSMGGYAAIAFARRLGCGTVLALSPQFRIDHPADTRWAARGAALRWPHRITPASLPPGGRAIVVLDPTGPDAWHLQQLQATLGAGAVHAVRVPHAGHPVSHFLVEAGVLRELALQALGSGQVAPALLAAARRKRWQSQAYLAPLAQRLAARAKPRLALRLIDHALADAPAHIRPGLLQQRSLLLAAAGRTAEAIAAAAEAATRMPQAPYLHAHHAQLLAAAGQTQAALAALDRALALDGSLRSAHALKVRLLWAGGRRLAAWAAAREALRLAPDGSALHRLLRWLWWVR